MGFSGPGHISGEFAKLIPCLQPQKLIVLHHSAAPKQLMLGMRITHNLRPPRPATGPSGPKCPWSVPESVPENGGCLRECPTGCLWGNSGPRLRSVQKVSRECPRSVKKVSRTLRGHSQDTFWTLRSPGNRRVPETPRRTLPRTPPVFGDTLGDTAGTL